MSEHIENAIADCESKIAQLTDLVEKLRWFQREFPHTAAAIEKKNDKPRKYKRRGKVDRPRKAVRGRPRASKGDRPTDRTTERAKPGPRPKAPRSLPNVSQGSDHDRVLAAIQSHDGRCRPREIIEATKFPAWKVSTLLKVLEAKHLVTRKGFTVQLAGNGAAAALKPDATPSAAPAMPSGNGHAAQAPASPASSVIVEARDLSLKMLVKKGPATFAQLLEAMPEETELDVEQRRHACMRTIRRLQLKNVIREVGDTYRLV